MLPKLTSKVKSLDQLDDSILKLAAQKANQGGFGSLSHNLENTRSLAHVTAGSRSLAQQALVNPDIDRSLDQLSGQGDNIVDSERNSLPSSRIAQTNGFDQTGLPRRQAIDTTQYLQFQ